MSNHCERFRIVGDHQSGDHVDGLSVFDEEGLQLGIVHAFVHVVLIRYKVSPDHFVELVSFFSETAPSATGLSLGTDAVDKSGPDTDQAVAVFAFLIFLIGLFKLIDLFWHFKIR